MNMRELTDTLSDFIKENIKIIIIILIILINLIGFLISNNNTYKTLLFYPNNDKTKLLAEKREIIKSFNKKNKIKNIIEELLLGPIDPEINNSFPIKSKLLSLRLEDDILYVNLSKETILDMENNDNKSYEIILLSIANTVSFQYNDIKKIKFYFDNIEYKYLGNYGPINNGINTDWSIFKK